MNIETLNTKVDQVVSSIENSQVQFTGTVDGINEELLDLKKRIEILEINNVSSEEGFTNLVNNNNLPTFVIALLITLSVYILNQPGISNKLNIVVPNKYLKSDNLKLIIILLLSFLLIKYN